MASTSAAQADIRVFPRFPTTDSESDDDQPCGPIQPAITADEIKEFVIPLAKPWKKWAENDVMRMVTLLRNRSCVVFGGCSAEATELYGLY
jgi:hypothetical protein